MKYLGHTPRDEHAFELDEEKRRNPLYGREIAAWCEEQFGKPIFYARKHQLFDKHERATTYWYWENCWEEKTIGLFYFASEDHAFAFRMRWA